MKETQNGHLRINKSQFMIKYNPLNLMYINKENRFVITFIILILFFGILSCDLLESNSDTDETDDSDNGQGQTELSNKIAFTSDRDGDDEIFIMDADGSNQQKLTDNEFADSAPAISNDGTQISFVSNRMGQFTDLYVMDADGSNVRRLTTAVANAVYSGWSPDDSKIIFDDLRDGSRNIFTINADGTGLQQLTSSDGEDGAASWSPDGSQIVFASSRDGDFEIFTMDANGSNLQQLTNNGVEDFSSPSAWSTNSDKIAFSSERSGNAEIYTIDTDGDNVTKITENTARDIYPTWSPDGNELIFSSERDNQREVYKKNADGSGVAVNLSSNSARESFPFHSPVE